MWRIAFLGGLLLGQTTSPVETLAREGKSKLPSLLALAAQHPQDQTGALAHLAAGALSAVPAEAVQQYTLALPRLPRLRDYVTYLIANSQFEADRFAESAKGAEALAGRGAASVQACASHGVLSAPAVQRIADSPLSQVVITNSIPLSPEAARCDKIRVLSVAKLLARAIDSIHGETSISVLFE